MKNDLSYESELNCQHSKNRFFAQKILLENSTQSEWGALIYDLVMGANYSYSRIAYRMKVSPSTIQKLATNPQRTPRIKILVALREVHHKVFKGPYALPKAKTYWAEKISSQELAS